MRSFKRLLLNGFRKAPPARRLPETESGVFVTYDVDQGRGALMRFARRLDISGRVVAWSVGMFDLASGTKACALKLLYRAKEAERYFHFIPFVEEIVPVPAYASNVQLRVGRLPQNYML